MHCTVLSSWPRRLVWWRTPTTEFIEAVPDHPHCAACDSVHGRLDHCLKPEIPVGRVGTGWEVCGQLRSTVKYGPTETETQ